MMRTALLYRPRGKALKMHAFVAGHEDGLWCINHALGWRRGRAGSNTSNGSGRCYSSMPGRERGATHE